MEGHAHQAAVARRHPSPPTGTDISLGSVHAAMSVCVRNVNCQRLPAKWHHASEALNRLYMAILNKVDKEAFADTEAFSPCIWREACQASGSICHACFHKQAAS